MRKRCILYPFIIILIVGGGLAVRYLPGIVPYWQCSEVYKRYKDVEGVRATYVKDYRVNDTLTMGVTLLEATTDSGWVRLQEDFGLPVIPKEYEKYFYEDSNKVSIKKYINQNSTIDTQLNDIIAISDYKHTICYFKLKNEEQREIFLRKLFNDKMKISNYEQYD